MLKMKWKNDLLMASIIIGFWCSHWESETSLKNPRFLLAAATRSTLNRTVPSSDISLRLLIEEMPSEADIFFLSVLLLIGIGRWTPRLILWFPKDNCWRTTRGGNFSSCGKRLFHWGMLIAARFQQLTRCVTLVPGQVLSGFGGIVIGKLWGQTDVMH